MSYPLLASLAPELPLTPVERPYARLPERLWLRFEGVPLACPAAWSDVAAAACLLAPERPVRVWRAAGFVVVGAPDGVLSGLDARGLRPLPFAPEEVEVLLPFLDARAPAHEMALGVASLLELAPVLTEEEVRAVVESEAASTKAPRALLERWRAPHLDERALVFHAGPDPVVEVRADLERGWLDLEPLCSGWTPGYHLVS